MVIAVLTSSFCNIGVKWKIRIVKSYFNCFLYVCLPTRSWVPLRFSHHGMFWTLGPTFWRPLHKNSHYWPNPITSDGLTFLSIPLIIRKYFLMLAKYILKEILKSQNINSWMLQKQEREATTKPSPTLALSSAQQITFSHYFQQF